MMLRSSLTFTQVLRLICLQSVLNSGLSSKVLEVYWFGYREHVKALILLYLVLITCAGPSFDKRTASSTS